MFAQRGVLKFQCYHECQLNSHNFVLSLSSVSFIVVCIHITVLASFDSSQAVMLPEIAEASAGRGIYPPQSSL